MKQHHEPIIARRMLKQLSGVLDAKVSLLAGTRYPSGRMKTQIVDLQFPNDPEGKRARAALILAYVDATHPHSMRGGAK